MGLDFAAFNSRLTLDADYFHKETFDIIMTRTIPSHVGGLSGPKSNVGTVLNKGFELSGAWRDRVENFSYGVNGSVSFVRNRVKSLDGGQIWPTAIRSLPARAIRSARSMSMRPTVTTSRRRRSTMRRSFTATVRNSGRGISSTRIIATTT
ncbi:MAG: TonB-dependent receptor [Alistipes senegalensis]